MRLDQYDRVLWDFNGTLYDDLALCMDCINTMLDRYDLPRLRDADAYREVFCFPVQRYYAQVGLPGEGNAFVKVAHEWLELYRAGEHTVPLRMGTCEALTAIGAFDVPQGVLSATEQRMLEEQIAYVGLAPYFDLVLGRNDIYAADKRQIAVRYAEMHPDERVLMIGDTVHDFETASAGGFDCILVEGGHQNRATLLTCGCPVVGSFEELVTYLTDPQA